MIDIFEVALKKKMKRKSTNSAVQNSDRSARRENLTGIPTQLKESIEQSTGLSFDDVRVHYNSARPARLDALAYTQGNQVEIGPGQECHLPHELGHVAQQKLGTVRANAMHSSGVPMNTDAGMERQADEIGAGKQNIAYNISTPPDREGNPSTPVNHGIVQRVIVLGENTIDKKFCKKNSDSPILQDIWKGVEDYAAANNLNNTQLIKLKREIKKMIESTLKSFAFTNILELMRDAFQRVQSFEEKEVRTERLIGGFTCLHGKLIDRMKSKVDMEEIFDMTPEGFKNYMLSQLKEQELEIPSGAGGIVMKHKSEISSIAGTITYEYNQDGIRFFIEIHPKGGIHYGAYFLMEFSHPLTPKPEVPAVKYVYSKHSTYLLLDEKRRLIFRKMDEDKASEVMEAEEGIEDKCEPFGGRQMGVDTPDAILGIPIRAIFSKKGMVATGIWTEGTRRSVAEQRRKIKSV